MCVSSRASGPTNRGSGNSVLVASGMLELRGYGDVCVVLVGAAVPGRPRRGALVFFSVLRRNDAHESTVSQVASGLYASEACALPYRSNILPISDRSCGRTADHDS